MNTYIQVFKNKTKYSRLYLIICLSLVLIGIVGLVTSYVSRRSLIPLFNDAAYFSLIFNGCIFFLFVWDSMKKSKYFVAWNNRELSYLLPKAGKTEVIKIENIKSVNINQNDIFIGLNNNERKHLKLHNIFFSERKIIVNFLEEVKKMNRENPVE